MATIEDLCHVVRNHPIIDNHGHNLLRLSQYETHEFLGISSEANGRALQDHRHSLAHFRVLRQLSSLYGLAPSTSWEGIQAYRQSLPPEAHKSLIHKCLKGTQTILIDDGLAGSDVIEPFDWHDQFTVDHCKRIVRIETVAADILQSIDRKGNLPQSDELSDYSASATAWRLFATSFVADVANLIRRSEVCGFKSVVCYRTGLDVEIEAPEDQIFAEFQNDYLPSRVAFKFRIEHKLINDWLVTTTCSLLSDARVNDDITKPFQFHTGLGDNDISLLRSNPAYLQPLIEAWPSTTFVLLHSSYPYTREAGYLATVFSNVYLDIGEVFPMVSRDGQEQIIRESLELTPANKVLWSTDGHFFPETYWLANVQGRKAVEKVMCEYVRNDDITVEQAIVMVKQILFENSNALYGLGLVAPASSSPQDDHFDGSAELISDRSRIVQANEQQSSPRAINNSSLVMPTGTRYVIVQWLDFLGTMRTRWLLAPAFQDLVATDRRLTISQGNLGTLQNDHMSPQCKPVGVIKIRPDITSLKRMHQSETMKDTASVMASFVNDDGSGLELCPRSFCARQESAWRVAGFEILVGFEIEVTFCRRIVTEYEPLDTNGHAWGSLSDQQSTSHFRLMCEIADALTSIGIQVQQFHSEAGAGQYEFVLSPLSPVKAVDGLIQARQCIQQIAASRDLRATCHPMPFSGIGTAAHAHISLNKVGAAPEALEKALHHAMAGILSHLPALCAVTMPQAVSYNRVVDDSWTGGTWVAWGTENREVPLRKVTTNRFEIRCLDGTANMYLAIGTTLALALHGLTIEQALLLKDCTVNPTSLSAQERQALGIAQRLPKSLTEAMDSLEHDSEFAEIASHAIISHYAVLKTAEQKMLSQMTTENRHTWLLERY